METGGIMLGSNPNPSSGAVTNPAPHTLPHTFSYTHRSIDDSPRASPVAKRLQVLRDHFTLFLYTNICRSLFEKDKLLFALSLAAQLAIADGRLPQQQLRFMATGTGRCGGRCGGWCGRRCGACEPWRSDFFYDGTAHGQPHTPAVTLQQHSAPRPAAPAGSSDPSLALPLSLADALSIWTTRTPTRLLTGCPVRCGWTCVSWRGWRQSSGA